MDDLKVLIIGAGTKGALYPDERLTHAHAFSRNGFKLVGFYDLDPVNLEKAYLRWNAPGYFSFNEALSKKPDVVTIAAHDEAHYGILQSIANNEHKPKLVFTEKPFCQNYKQAKIIADRYQKEGIKLSVNYSRRFLPKYRNLKIDPAKFIRSSVFCAPNIHTACHYIDLMTLWNIQDTHVGHVNRSDLNVFEAELYFQDQKISLLDHGSLIRIVPTKPREDYPEDMVLDYENERTIHVDLSAAMELAAHNIREHLLHNEPLICTVDNALKVMEACDKWQS